MDRDDIIVEVKVLGLAGNGNAWSGEIDTDVGAEDEANDAADVTGVAVSDADHLVIDLLEEYRDVCQERGNASNDHRSNQECMRCEEI